MTPRLPILAAVAVLGFYSGLPLALSSGTLQAWLTTSGVDITAIGLFGLAGLPYTFKFLWAPLFDRFLAPGAAALGRRRGWMLAMQLAVVGGIAALASLEPEGNLWGMAVAALWLAFASASFDVAFDAWRTEVTPGPRRALGAAWTVTGYRLAMLVSGAFALMLGDWIGWQATYGLMALLMATGLLLTWLAPEAPLTPPPRTLLEAVIGPWQAFWLAGAALAWLALIVLYKLGDAAAGSLSTAFLIRGAGFSAAEVGAVNKGLGLALSLGGALLGGWLVPRIGLWRALLAFGLLQAVTNLGFLLLALAGRDWTLLLLAVGLENLAGGMGTAAFVALLMHLTDARYTAAQYALLSAAASLGRVLISPVAGVVVAGVGWAWFFAATVVLALPGLALLWGMRGRVAALEQRACAAAAAMPR